MPPTTPSWPLSPSQASAALTNCTNTASSFLYARSLQCHHSCTTFTRQLYSSRLQLYWVLGEVFLGIVTIPSREDMGPLLQPGTGSPSPPPQCGCDKASSSDYLLQVGPGSVSPSSPSIQAWLRAAPVVADEAKLAIVFTYFFLFS